VEEKGCERVRGGGGSRGEMWGKRGDEGGDNGELG